MLVFLVSSGFIANASAMPGGWIAAFYSNPLAWFIKGEIMRASRGVNTKGSIHENG